MTDAGCKPRAINGRLGPPFPVGALIEPRDGGRVGEITGFYRPLPGHALTGGWWATISYRDGGPQHVARVSRATHRLAIEVGP